MDFDFIQDYLTGLTPQRHPELAAMEEEVERTGFPIIGPACGHLCYLLAKLSGAKRIFEMGSGYGYSTAWFARAVHENGGGVVYHTVWDASLSKKAQKHLTVLGYTETIEYQVGESVQLLRETPGPFDLIFNDIDKPGYPESLAITKQKLKPGGLLIVDNLLYHGSIFDPSNQSASVQGVREFTRLIMHDPAWIASILPVRDGLLIARKN